MIDPIDNRSDSGTAASSPTPIDLASGPEGRSSAAAGIEAVTPTIVVGVGGDASPGDADRLVEVGAGEFFVGFVPPRWSDRFGFELSPNRRYRASNQFVDIDRLHDFVGRAGSLGAHVALTMNEHYYTDAMWAAALDITEEALSAGIGAIIVASPGACIALRERFPDVDLHVSGEAAVANVAALDLFAGLGASRIVFAREITGPALRILAPLARERGMEVETFIMGEPCVYDGARCFADHGYGSRKDFCNSHLVKELRVQRRDRFRADPTVPHEAIELRPVPVHALGKCGLCAVPAFASAGVTHLKVPGRSTDAVDGVLLVTKAIAAYMRDGIDSVSQMPGILDLPDLCHSGDFCYFPEFPRGTE